MMLDDPEYAAQVRYDSDAEILRRLLHIACVSDRLDTDLVGERVPILVGELERRGCHTDPGWAEIVKEIWAAAHRTDHPALTAAAKARSETTKGGQIRLSPLHATAATKR
jgi:hypothetical protein